MSGFSYAQAARGQATPPSQAPVAVASNTTSSGAPATVEKDADNNSAAASQNGSITAPTHFTTDSSKLFARKFSQDADASPMKSSEAPSSPAASSTLAGTATESTSIFSLDDAPARVASSENPLQAPTPDPRSPTAETVRKGGRKGKAAGKSNAEKDGEQIVHAEVADKATETVKVELVSAPLPSVNIWSQRMQEQAAKTKQAPAVTAANKTTMSTPNTAGGARSKDARKQTNIITGTDVASDTASASPSGNTKSQIRRANEIARLGGTDQSRRNASRGVRGAIDKDERLTVNARNTLPLVRGVSSWPTPESAAVTEEAKASVLLGDSKAVAASDQNSQDDATSVKSRKKGWVPLPFVPSVNFQTPMPNVRNSRAKTGSRTGRDAPPKIVGNSDANGNSGHTGTDTIGTETISEKALAASSPAKAHLDVRSAAKDINGNALSARPSSQPPHVNKRLSTDASQNHARESRKALGANLPEKPEEAGADQPNAASKADFFPKSNQHSNHIGTNGGTNGHHQQPAHPPYVDRRPAYSVKNFNNFNSSGKDFVPQEYKDQHSQHVRERTEPRGDRSSRGGSRGGRGGAAAAAAAPNSQHTGHSTYQPNGQRAQANNSYSSGSSGLPATAAPFHPHPHSQQFSFGNAHNSLRLSSRNVARAPLSPHGPSSYGNRLQSGAGNNNTRMHGSPSHGASGGPVEYQAQPYAFSAFNPFMDAELLHGLMLQVDYYFSLDNLVKDVFLRRKMNDQGFVPLSVIAKFKRMAELAPSIDFIRAACEQSENLDYVVDQEQNEWIRSRYLWSNFLLPHEDRDEEARKPGPDLRTAMFRSVQRPYQAYMHPLMGGAYPAMQQQGIYGQPMYPVNGNEVIYQQHDNSMHVGYMSPVGGSGVTGVEPNGLAYQIGESQLSAAVPDFSPSGHSGAPTTLEDYQTCPDEQVDKLVVLVGSESDSTTECVEHPETNGSNTNGTPKIGQEPYPKLRALALEQRSKAKAGEIPSTMKQLYRFWSHCLPDKFNVRMYEDFRAFAVEDARQRTPNDFGLKCLLQYYNNVLSGPATARPYPSVFLPHCAEAKQVSESQSLQSKIPGDSRA
ncbi:hypothetical protein SEPCBS119000_002826 [Sporothrix epigloea]|uniref:HTH La-type RNA-binding domain-containing protein n=1 Tax=Sporothrix epigloea TaxID=1892477 RepID=A0ABP0DI85_9PEZI